ncbi:CPBP family intramembrane glutamic endopeptidase [Frateuria aurantia]|uniref:CAAX prenyl protease 2/Lysostaphin resistance protein A-like domain-containing protein n=1 Tax=Frateuria aurantia (strain ATCC 33424 / DSM 6220 / KCTC 2777 / LMG 1558 / NBRC 3245 / NCIMB 13370) TaxID=767434 RepID=H8L0V9_FRAAD|nr:CPBP family intramembrane glutamic endopeptidase [Frateuria aurantia]AFC85352.1 hypothetical protein Fraau_0883 [Frateuria aurantia DSM 6220]
MARIFRYAGLAVAVLMLLGFADWLSRQLVASQLALSADHDRLTWQQGLPRWQWDLQKPEQLIAKRVFGPALAGADPGGLRLTAQTSAPYQLGLRLTGPIDLGHWPRLHLDYRSDQVLLLAVIAAGGHRAACNSPFWSLPPGHDMKLALDQVPWHTDDGRSCRPGRADILRLVLKSAPGRVWQLRRAALWPTGRPGTSVLATAEIAPTINLPDGRRAARQVLDQAAQRYPHAAAPIVTLASATPAGGLLQWRDAIRAHWPGAIVVPQAADASLAAFRLPLAWWVLGGYALALLVLLRYPLPSRQGALEALACMAGPLWLIVGMHFGRPDPGASAAAAALGLISAARMGWSSTPLRQGETATRLAHWLRPLALLPIALLLARSGHTPLTWPGVGHGLVYLAWALLQQALMLRVVLPRMQRSLPAGLALLATAGLFMLLHAPNGELMQACLLAELYWAWCYQRDRHLLPIAVGHAAAALLLQAGMGPQSLVRSLEVSARFMQ